MRYYNDKRRALDIMHSRFNVCSADLLSMYGEYLDPLCDQSYAVLYRSTSIRESLDALKAMLRIHSYINAR